MTKLSEYQDIGRCGKVTTYIFIIMKLTKRDESDGQQKYSLSTELKPRKRCAGRLDTSISSKQLSQMQTAVKKRKIRIIASRCAFFLLLFKISTKPLSSFSGNSSNHTQVSVLGFYKWIFKKSTR